MGAGQASYAARPRARFRERTTLTLLSRAMALFHEKRLTDYANCAG